MPLLDAGAPFPSLALHTGRHELALDTHLDGHYGVVLFYRGSWCPYCNAQLASFQRATERLAALDIRVVALSVDDEPTTSALVAELGLTFPVGHSADAAELATATGAFVHHDPLYVQSTGFVLAPDRSVIVSCYSSGAIGRLVPADVAGLVEYVAASSPGAA